MPLAPPTSKHKAPQSPACYSGRILPRDKPRKRGSAAAPASAATRRRQSAAGQAAAPHQQQPREEQGVRGISG